MAIGVIFNFPGGTTEQYDEVCRGLAVKVAPPNEARLAKIVPENQSRPAGADAKTARAGGSGGCFPAKDGAGIT